MLTDFISFQLITGSLNVILNIKVVMLNITKLIIFLEERGK